MTGFALALLGSVVAPTLAGWALLRAVVPAGSGLAALGGGFFLGMLALAVLVPVAYALGLPDPHVWITLLLVAAGLASLTLAHRRGGLNRRSPMHDRPPAWARLLTIVLFALLALRITTLTITAFANPLSAWDAWRSWVPPVKVWSETGELTHFEFRRHWVENPNTGSYTIEAHREPNFIRYIQLHSVRLYGAWSPHAAQLTWPACLVAFLLLFYAILMSSGMTPLVSIFGTYLLSSLPYFNANLAMAGNVEIWVASALSLSVLFTAEWIKTDRNMLLMGAILSAIALPMIERAGWVWLVVLVIALGLSSLRRKWLLALAAVSSIGAVSLWAIGGIEISIPGTGHLSISGSDKWVLSPDRIRIPGLFNFQLGYHPVWHEFFKYWFLMPNWHLLFPILFLGVPWLVAESRRNRNVRFIFWFLICALAMILAMFLFTPRYEWAENGTAINRVVLHFAPVIVLAILLPFHCRADDENTKSNRS